MTWLLFADNADNAAAAQKVKDAFSSETALWMTAALAGILLVGAFVLSWLQRWRKRQLATDDNPAGQLTNFRAMYEAGELSKEEYDRILARVATRTKAKFGSRQPELPARPASNDPNPPPPPEHPG